MTPKEKALDLVGKMCGNNCTETNINRMIKSALIAVDELIIEKNKWENGSFYTSKYWDYVKKEIEKL